MAPETGLSLNRFAQILGIHPLHFHQIGSIGDRPQGCGMVWLEHDWQGPTHVSRESIAFAIRQAENDLEQFLGFPLYPKWFEDIFIPMRFSPVVLPKAYYITGGVRAETLIQSGAPLSYEDDDDDGFSEIATANITVTFTDTEEIDIRYPGLPDRIRPVKVTILDGIATITLNRYDLVIKSALEALSPEQLDGLDDDNFLDSIDVYRVYNDPSQQVTLQSKCRRCGTEFSCAACEFDEFTGCIQAEQKKSSIVHVTPATYTDGTWTHDFCLHEHIYAGRFNFKAGWTGDNIWEEAITYLAISRLNVGLCACPTVKDKIDWWATDFDRSDRTASYKPQNFQKDNPWGHTRGAMYAYSVAWKHRMPQGVL